MKLLAQPLLVSRGALLVSRPMSGWPLVLRLIDAVVMLGHRPCHGASLAGLCCALGLGGGGCLRAYSAISSGPDTGQTCGRRGTQHLCLCAGSAEVGTHTDGTPGGVGGPHVDSGSGRLPTQAPLRRAHLLGESGRDNEASPLGRLGPELAPLAQMAMVVVLGMALGSSARWLVVRALCLHTPVAGATPQQCRATSMPTWPVPWRAPYPTRGSNSTAAKGVLFVGSVSRHGLVSIQPAAPRLVRPRLLVRLRPWLVEMACRPSSLCKLVARPPYGVSHRLLGTPGASPSPGRWPRSFTPTLKVLGANCWCFPRLSWMHHRVVARSTRRPWQPTPLTASNGGTKESGLPCGTAACAKAGPETQTPHQRTTAGLGGCAGSGGMGQQSLRSLAIQRLVRWQPSHPSSPPSFAPCAACAHHPAPGWAAPCTWDWLWGCFKIATQLSCRDFARPHRPSGPTFARCHAGRGWKQFPPATHCSG